VAAEPIGINNRVRRELSAALAALRLFSSERDVRWQAAQEVTLSADAKMLPLLDKALAGETDPEIKTRLQLAHAQASLGSTDPGVRLDAVRTLGDSSDPRVRQLLIPLTEKRGDNWLEAGQRSPCGGRHVDPRSSSGWPGPTISGAPSPASRSARSCCSPRSAWRSPTA
jgi:urea transport system permease protein